MVWTELRLHAAMISAVEPAKAHAVFRHRCEVSSKPRRKIWQVELSEEEAACAAQSALQ
jgi:hypothetical protein